MARKARPLKLRLQVRHLHGPRRVQLDTNEVVVLSVVRNAELHIRTFLDHHLSLGAGHVVLLLNDTTDATPAIAAQYDRVTLLHCSCPYKRYEELMKRYLVRRFAAGRWSLFVDADELFDYPGSALVPLSVLTQYLDRHNYTAVVAQMLDMFAAGPLDAVHSSPQDDLRSCYQFYDLESIERQPYKYGVLGHPDIRLHVGGVRKQVFGTDNGLTKAVLVKSVATVQMFSDWHHAYGSHAADFTAVLLHYPFVEGFSRKVAEAAASRRYASSADDEYQRYAAVVVRQPVVLWSPRAKKLISVDRLLDDGFLVASIRARRALQVSADD